MSMELFDRQKDAVGQGERTILVHVELTSVNHLNGSLDEFQQLAESSGLSIIETLSIKRSFTKAQFLIGTGKVDELALLVQENEIDLVIFSIQLSPSQERNLEKALKVLRSRLYEIELAKKMAADSAKRKSMVSSGDRSAKIRTYNYPQGRVTDHRISFTSHALTAIMGGDLNPVIEALRMAEQAELLAAES